MQSFFVLLSELGIKSRNNLNNGNCAFQLFDSRSFGTWRLDLR